MGRPMAPCGTDAAYRRHLRRGEPTDEACRRAHNDARKAARRSPAASLDAPTFPDDEATASDTDGDDMKLLVDTLRAAFVKVADADPTKVAPIAREFRSAVEASRGAEGAPKELSLADQLAAAREGRAARAAGQVASA